MWDCRRQVVTSMLPCQQRTLAAVELTGAWQEQLLC